MQIKDINERNKIPILVGGTNYYIQSLLYESLMDETVDSKKTTESIEIVDKYYKMQKENPSQLYQELLKVDPIMANKIHPNDYRKIRRSLEIYETTGIRQSNHIIQQLERNKKEQPRYNVRCIWLTCDLDILHKRLNDRVDNMIKDGLIDEVKLLWNTYTGYQELGYLTGKSIVDKKEDDDEDDDRKSVDSISSSYSSDSDGFSGEKIVKTTQGIWQSIGLKEFKPLFVDGDKSGDKELLNKCVEKIKTNTYQYAKKQISFINKRFCARNLPILKCDTSNLDKWNENVTIHSINYLKDLFSTTDTPILPPPKLDLDPRTAEKHYCEICDKLLVGKQQWESHINSNKHKKRKSNQRKNKDNPHYPGNKKRKVEEEKNEESDKK